mmetsp:Transcript_17654/g.35173  ORF Transcript_17654/g.35173 Transcript_17654/m.35173 type:complete len:95 (+) Transcript_17654:1443-1727(+)
MNLLHAYIFAVLRIKIYTEQQVDSLTFQTVSERKRRIAIKTIYEQRVKVTWQARQFLLWFSKMLKQVCFFLESEIHYIGNSGRYFGIFAYFGLL